MNYYEPPVQPDVIDCPECNGGNTIKNFYSECCGVSGYLSVHNPVCKDCKEPCKFITEPCELCKGTGWVEPNLEEEYLNHMEQKYERRKDEF